mgnify:CR=1 FL=1
MKKSFFYSTLILITLLVFSRCTYNNIATPAQTYSVSIEVMPNKNAPSLQSFAHGVSNNKWLLFAGRTNSKDSLNGGLHDLNGNYSNTSFTPPSFNERIYVYDVATDAKPISISINELVKRVKTKCSTFSEGIPYQLTPCYKLNEALKNNLSVFKNSNALVKQVGEYLYVIGGYGAINFATPKNGYTTYNQIAKINVRLLIQLVEGEKELIEAEWIDLMSFGKNENLISTGGELQYINGKFYLVGGHNFGNSAPKVSQGQKYVDAVYPFSLSVNKGNGSLLDVSISAAITDVSNPRIPAADNISIFRRRDGPILPSLYKSPISGKIASGIAIYAGVFKPGDDSNLQAWNDAIYIHPQWANKESKLFTYDKSYNQNNYNVYAAPSFVAYDSSSEVSHSYLLGGIGDGKFGFTNTGTHITTNISNYPIASKNEIFSQNLFSNNTTNIPPFYGAEAILFPNQNINYTTYSDEIIDLNTSFKDTNTIEIGYIFGGIEAFKSNPGTYGKRNSRASNLIWKVTLKK